VSWIALCVAVLGGSAGAHHSAAPHFDLGQTIVVTGVVTRFEFVNPHAYVYFDVRGSDGQAAAWRCELASRTSLGRLGWTPDLFAVGQTITVKGAPARRESNVCMLTSFVRQDGVEIGRNEDITRLRAVPVEARAGNTTGGIRPARLATGQPNLQGPWLGAGRGGGRGRPGGPGRDGRGGPGRGGPGGPAFPGQTPAGAEASKRYDQRFDDPAIFCNPANILFGWTHDQHVNEITQKRDEIAIQYGYMDFVRTVHLNAKHPARIVPSTAGHSTGTWDGDVLVVDTVGLKTSVLIPIAGIMHSDQMHVVERFSVDASGTTLTRAFRAEDPLYLAAPYTGTDTMTLSPEPYTRYNCVELSGKNNQRSQ
jgi:hypothetical protein